HRRGCRRRWMEDVLETPSRDVGWGLVNRDDGWRLRDRWKRGAASRREDRGGEDEPQRQTCSHRCSLSSTRALPWTLQQSVAKSRAAGPVARRGSAYPPTGVPSSEPRPALIAAMITPANVTMPSARTNVSWKNRHLK